MNHTGPPMTDQLQTGQFKSYNDIPADSFIKILPRFQPDVFDENLKLVHEVEKMASSKGATPAQVALGWAIAHSGKPGMPEILPIPGATTAERINENMKPAKLTEEDMSTLNEILKKFRPIGDRYHAAGMAHTNG